MSSYQELELTSITLPPNELLQQPIPYVIDDFSLALHLGIRCKTLWFCVNKRDHLYHVFSIPKANGKRRLIHNPHPVLKFVQRRVDYVFLKPLPLHPCVGAYVIGKSCKDTASKHVGQGVRIGMDLQDFFPSHSAARIRGFFHYLGYSQFVSGLLATLCTAPFRKRDQTGDKKFTYRAPQGSPASPSLCNLIAQLALDQAVLHTFGPEGWTYTRYSDDLCLSHPADLTRKDVDDALSRMYNLIEKAGYRTNREKTKVQRRWRRQKVLGIVVNEKVSVPRDEYRRYRALLHNCLTQGWLVNALRFGWDPVETFHAHVHGKIVYIKHIDPVKGEKLEALYAQVIEKYGTPCDEQRHQGGYILSSEPQEEHVGPPVLQR